MTRPDFAAEARRIAAEWCSMESDAADAIERFGLDLYKRGEVAGRGEALAVVEAARYGITPLPEFLEWVADRLVRVYGESEHVDFVTSLRERAMKFRAALAARERR